MARLSLLLVMWPSCLPVTWRHTYSNPKVLSVCKCVRVHVCLGWLLLLLKAPQEEETGGLCKVSDVKSMTPQL